MQYFVIASRALIGVVFLVSFWSKARGRAAFAAFVDSVAALGVAPSGPTAPVAGAVVAAEGAIWVLLVTPSDEATAAGLSLAAVLLSAFAVAIARSVHRGARTSCRCFGATTVPLGPRHVVRNVFLIAVCVGGALAALGGTAKATAAGGAVAAVAGLILGALVTLLDDLAALFAPAGPHADSAPRRPQAHARPRKHARPQAHTQLTRGVHAGSDQRPGPRGSTVHAGSDPHRGRGQTPA
ncbi:MauE/DoxX family redox-associated membrane protein [Streptomyces olivoreticuli]